jgi:hypothetical protein
LSINPSVLLKETSSYVAATLAAGGSSGCRVGLVRPSATRQDTPPYASSPSTNVAMTARLAKMRQFLTPGDELYAWRT